jgi:hypothetical protein
MVAARGVRHARDVTSTTEDPSCQSQTAPSRSRDTVTTEIFDKSDNSSGCKPGTLSLPIRPSPVRAKSSAPGAPAPDRRGGERSRPKSALRSYSGRPYDGTPQPYASRAGHRRGTTMTEHLIDVVIDPRDAAANRERRHACRFASAPNASCAGTVRGAGRAVCRVRLANARIRARTHSTWECWWPMTCDWIHTRLIGIAAYERWEGMN